jgi:hypothetical protein
MTPVFVNLGNETIACHERTGGCVVVDTPDDEYVAKDSRPISVYIAADAFFVLIEEE